VRTKESTLVRRTKHARALARARDVEKEKARHRRAMVRLREVVQERVLAARDEHRRRMTEIRARHSR